MTDEEPEPDARTRELPPDGDEEVMRRLERRIRAALSYRARPTSDNHYWVNYPFEFWDKHLDDLVTDGLSLGLARGKGLHPLESVLQDAFQVAGPVIFGYIQLAGRLNDRANTEWRPTNVRTQPKIGALVQLHARALVLLEEIILLAFSGYPSGATTISRTMQEVRITAKFLYRYESRISERYVASHIVEMWRNKEDYIPRGSAGRSKRSRAVEADLDARYAEVIRKYGPSMAIPNGWAWPRLEGRYGNGSKLPRYIQISQLRAAVGDRHDRQRYRHSSHQVHGGFIGAIQTLAFDDPDVALLGPRPSNLARPLLDALFDVQEVSACLLRACDNLVGDRAIAYWLEALDQLSYVARGMVRNAQDALDEYFQPVENPAEPNLTAEPTT